ncbi:MAG: LysM peptidoglycan-binding domain-containing protein [Gammaproteobacteria bacterium]|nr:LysM peptidoglycan-binding domain-containing protein [Gammaproteobacteria bacterium]
MKMFSTRPLSWFGLLAATLLIGNTVIAATPFSVSAAAQSGTVVEVVLNADHPERYTVVKGDTLWDISAMFLRDPWLWPEIWDVNPQIENPHLIYPGDVLTLVWLEGKPKIIIQRSGTSEKIVPGVRVNSADAAIATIPFDRISAFLSRAGVASKQEMQKLPYIAALRNAMIAGAGDEVYVRGLKNPQIGEVYRVIRQGDKVVDPETNDRLGYEIIYIGSGTIVSNGDTAKMMLNDTTREAKEGDRVIKVDTLPPLNFYPRSPETETEGQIISVKDGVSRIGQYQMVLINRGLEHGMEPGYVLSIWQPGKEVYDRKVSSGMSKKFMLPDERIGILMVLKPMETSSYALVMEAYSEIRTGDRLRNP